MSYNLYVIELDKEVWKNKRFRERNPDYKGEKPCVYIGQTARTPELRFEQHKAGKRANRFAKRFGLKLRPKNYRKHQGYEKRNRAKLEEKRLAERLQKKGYAVWWN
jgi:GIY-YIG catalytic domain